MSRASDKSKDAVEGKADSVGSLASDEEGEEDDGDDIEDAGREETPDLYRNSSLGMYVLHFPSTVHILTILNLHYQVWWGKLSSEIVPINAQILMFVVLGDGRCSLFCGR